MNKFALKILIALLALSLAGCAAYFSVIGLAKLFAGAGVAVVIMAGVLEASKLIIASFLHNQWNEINGWLRSYLVIAIVIIFFWSNYKSAIRKKINKNYLPIMLDIHRQFYIKDL